ncbi:hypothetical protein DXA97_01020 [Clostridium sp. OF09-36]|nr:hypothetical protein DXA97_01020 [Clostridium sp. OF09-36]
MAMTAGMQNPQNMFCHVWQSEISEKVLESPEGICLPAIFFTFLITASYEDNSYLVWIFLYKFQCIS